MSKFIIELPDVTEDKLHIIEKRWNKLEKIIKIIKTKNVNIVELKMSSSVKQYNNAISFMMFYKKEYELTQEEFNLLKEVLEVE